MLEIAIALIIGFALEYGVREWISRQRHQAERRREPAITPAPNRGKNRGCSAETGNSGLAQDCVVVNAAECELVSPCISGKCREILRKCREGIIQARRKDAQFQPFGRRSPYSGEQGEI
jgi:hypothetical protein